VVPRGSRLRGLSVNFLSGARGRDVTATARVIRRGRSITVCEVGVAGEDSEEVARALVTYKLGG
jgi:acyl-coenzyme A thioesterase PaaI-like protein